MKSIEQVITETLRTVRDIWKQYGDIDEIHVELGREMKNPADKLRQMTQQISDNENANLRIKALLMEFANPEFKIEETTIRMTPEVGVDNLKTVYPDVIIKKADGTDITSTNELIGTGYKIVIDNIEYTAIKYGDCNGDGKIKASDYVLIKNYIFNGDITVKTIQNGIANSVSYFGPLLVA